jgi:hypothetical protein
MTGCVDGSTPLTFNRTIRFPEHLISFPCLTTTSTTTPSLTPNNVTNSISDEHIHLGLLQHVEVLERVCPWTVEEGFEDGGEVVEGGGKGGEGGSWIYFKGRGG